MDWDDTLVRSVGSKRIAIPSAMQHVREPKAAGAVFYCWRTGGGDDVRNSAEELGIAECFEMVLPKPNVMVEDQPAAEWRCLLTIPPRAAA